MKINYDVIVIGAGPNGLYMSYQLKKIIFHIYV